VFLFAGGTRADPAQHASTVELTRWLFPYLFFMGTTALGAAALNASQRFVVTAFAPALLNVACIACALALPAWFASEGRDPVLAMAVGVLLGGALQAVAQWPSLKATGYLERPRFEFSHPGVRETFRRMAPALFGLGVYLIDVMLSRRFLSELGVGPQTYFGFALRLCDFPQGIFVMAIQTAALPSLSALAARGEKAELEATYAFGVRLTLFVGIAATVLFVALASPIVTLLFQRGEFDQVAARETARALVAQGLGIWTVAVVRQLLAVYYALGDTRRPVLVSLLDLGVFIGLALGLRGPLGHVGIGVAVAGSSAVQMVLLAAGLRRHLSDSRLGEIARSAGRTLIAAGAAGAAGAGSASVLGDWSAGGFAATIAPGVGGTVVFGVVFLAVAHAVGSEELRSIRSALERRRGARPKSAL
jgi:putative peptidoglycan lipid II flippase